MFIQSCKKCGLILGIGPAKYQIDFTKSKMICMKCYQGAD